jgi:hypothetical protein
MWLDWVVTARPTSGLTPRALNTGLSAERDEYDEAASNHDTGQPGVDT